MGKKVLKDVSNLTSLERGILILFAAYLFPTAAHRAMVVSLGSTITIYILNLFIILGIVLVRTAIAFDVGKEQTLVCEIILVAICIIYIILYLYDLVRIIISIDRQRIIRDTDRS
jgi:hypothetical protein